MKQTTRTLITLVVLAAAGAGLALYASWGVQKADERHEAQKDHDDRLFAPEKVGEKGADGGTVEVAFVKLTLTTSGVTTTVERNGNGAWQVTAPVAAPADRFAIDAVTSQLQTTKIKAVIDEAPDAAAEAKYGLVAPQWVLVAEVLVGDAKERRTVTLEGGIENTFDGTVFLRRNHERTVYSVPGGVRWSFAKTTFDLRDKSIFPADESEVIALSVKGTHSSFTAERDGEKRWRIVQPFDDAADQEALKGMLGALKNEKAIAFPDDGAAFRHEVGLETPTLVATFTTAGAQKTTLTFSRQQADGGDTRAFVARDGALGPLLAEVAPTAPGPLDRSAGELKDRAILTFPRDAVRSVRVHPASGDDVVLERSAGTDGGAETWAVKGPGGGPAKPFKLATLLWTLGSLKATTFGDTRPKDWAKYGLGPSARSVTLVDGAGAVLARLELGKDVPGKPGLIYFRGNRDQVLEGDASRLTEIPFTAAEVLEPAAQKKDAGG
ncbi:MAG: DUF4340 domain-containing protein [Myxococcaceae bacterium]|nr:DUF4340 domain-containing protein [Myxococcaceae bacterium]